jgi:hypothetical protein
MVLTTNKIVQIRLFFIIKRIWGVFRYSIIWITLPLFIICAPKVESEIVYNQSFLTSYSVSVSGYTRADGTYVSGYNRRPPGSVSHDLPYQNAIRTLRFFNSLLYLSLFFSSIFLLVSGFKSYKLFKSDFENYIHNQVLEKLNFNFNELLNKPFHLINRRISRYSSRSTYKCVICSKSIEHNQFHYSDLSERSPKKTCLTCMNTRWVRFKDELYYVGKFERMLELFSQEYTKTIHSHFQGFELNKHIIENCFYEKVKEIRKGKF